MTVKEVKILETAEDIQERREQVLKRYVEFKESARIKREKLEDSRRFCILCLYKCVFVYFAATKRITFE